MRGLRPSLIFQEAIARLRGTHTPPPVPAPDPPTRRLRTAESEAVYVDDVRGVEDHEAAEDVDVNDFVEHALVESPTPITETEIEIVEDPDTPTAVIPEARLKKLLRAASGRRWL